MKGIIYPIYDILYKVKKMETEEIYFRSWEPSNGGAVRYYLNGWALAAGFDWDTYKTGNISDSSYKGEPIAHGRMTRILGTKVWCEEDGTLHIDYFDGAGIIDEDELRQALNAYLNAHPEVLEEAKQVRQKDLAMMEDLRRRREE